MDEQGAKHCVSSHLRKIDKVGRQSWWLCYILWQTILWLSSSSLTGATAKSKYEGLKNTIGS